MPYFLFGHKILTESEQVVPGSPLRLAIIVDDVAYVKKLEGSFDLFDSYYKQLFTGLVAEVHKYLIRLTPVHTGKLRGGWAAFLDKHQISYARQLFDTSLYNIFKKVNSTPAYREYDFDHAEVNEGRALSRLEDKLPQDTDVSVENKVPYKDIMEFGTSHIQGRHFMTQSIYKGEFWFEKHFNQWLSAMEKAGAIIPSPKVTEIPN